MADSGAAQKVPEWDAGPAQLADCSDPPRHPGSGGPLLVTTMPRAFEYDGCRHRAGALKIAQLELKGVVHRSVDHQAPCVAIEMRGAEMVAPEVLLKGHRVVRQHFHISRYRQLS